MISPRLKSVILAELDLEEFDMTGDMKADAVPGWDSLSHVRIIVAIEAAYGIRFSTLEILNMRQIADLQNLIDRKTG